MRYYSPLQFLFSFNETQLTLTPTWVGAKSKGGKVERRCADADADADAVDGDNIQYIRVDVQDINYDALYWGILYN